MSDGGFEVYPPPPPPPLTPPPSITPSRSRRKLFLFLGGVFAIFIVFISLLILLASSFGQGDNLDLNFGGDKVALVEVTGVIEEPRETVDLIRKYAKDTSIRAIVVRLNSPGGGVAASQEIYEEVKRVRDTSQKPVVASISTVGASGAYYIACGATKIVANAGSLTGSIGVIANWTNYGDLYRWAKLKDVTFKSGAMKAAGSPVRDPSEEEKQYFQELINEMHEQFVESVAEGRKMPIEEVKRLADGRAYSGAHAKKLGLVDEIGNLQDAITLASKLAGLKGEPKIVEPAKEKVTLFDILFGNLERFLPIHGKVEPVLEYRWTMKPLEQLEK